MLSPEGHASYEQQFLSFIILPCSVSKKVMRTHNKGTLWEYHWNFIKIAPCQASERNCCCYIILYGCIECATPHYTTHKSRPLRMNQKRLLHSLPSLAYLSCIHPLTSFFFCLQLCVLSFSLLIFHCNASCMVCFGSTFLGNVKASHFSYIYIYTHTYAYMLTFSFDKCEAPHVYIEYISFSSCWSSKFMQLSVLVFFFHGLMYVLLYAYTWSCSSADFLVFFVYICKKLMIIVYIFQLSYLWLLFSCIKEVVDTSKINCGDIFEMSC